MFKRQRIKRVKPGSIDEITRLVENEKRFHNQLYSKSGKNAAFFSRFITSLRPHNRFHHEKIFNRIGEIGGKRICEIGCGVGELCFKLVEKNAFVTAIDISDEAVKIAAQKNEIFVKSGRVTVEVRDVHELPYLNDYFDFVIGDGVLHHLNVNTAVREIHRIMKPGGRGVFIEPLTYNPICTFYRFTTPSNRTVTERPLRYDDINTIGRLFSTCKYEEFNLLTLLSTIAYLISFSNSFKKRFAEIMVSGDRFLLPKFKFLRRYCEQVLIEVVK